MKTDIARTAAEHTFKFLKKHGPLVCSVLASVGVVATGVLAARGDRDARAKLEEAYDTKNLETDDEIPLTATEAMKVAWKSYVPAVAIGGATIACIFGAHVLNKRQQAAILSAYMMTRNTANKYMDEVKSRYGEEVHNDIMRTISVEQAKEVRRHCPGFVGSTELGFYGANEEERTFYIPYFDIYFESTISQVMQAELLLNRDMVLGDCISVNDFMELLGLPPSHDNAVNYDECGWAVNDLYYFLDFDNQVVQLDDGLEVCTIEFAHGPEYFQNLLN